MAWVSDAAQIQLWCRPAAAALIGPLAWEFPCTAGAAPKRKKKKKIPFQMLFQLWELSKCGDSSRVEPLGASRRLYGTKVRSPDASLSSPGSSPALSFLSSASLGELPNRSKVPSAPPWGCVIMVPTS